LIRKLAHLECSAYISPKAHIAVERRYNVILIVSDTFRYDLLNRCFTVKGSVKARVPRIDKLAREGVLFTHAYTASFPTVPHRHDLLAGPSRSPTPTGSRYPSTSPSSRKLWARRVMLR